MVRKERESTGYRPDLGDRVICEHKGTNYEAKVIGKDDGKDSKESDRSQETKYKVHYQGWNKNWDEWVPLNRIQEYNETNVKNLLTRTKGKATKGPGSGRKKLGIQQNNQSSSSISSQPEEVAPIEPIVVEPEEQISLEEEQEEEEEEVKIRIPEELKAWLIDDDDNIKNKKLTPLPAKIPITTILKDFILHKKNTSRITNDASLNELTLGIKDYFNVMLGSHLLYKFERLQYQNLLREEGKEVDLAAHYGVIHLLRLFTKIGKVLAQSSLEPQNLQIIVSYMHELLKFISKQSNLFEKNYNVAPPDYIKNALK